MPKIQHEDGNPVFASQICIPSVSASSSPIDDALKYLRGGKLGTVDTCPFTEEEEKRILRKIDRMLLPLMVAVYNIQYLDKTICKSQGVHHIVEALHTNNNCHSELRQR
jgi:hypothetical protein